MDPLGPLGKGGPLRLLRAALWIPPSVGKEDPLTPSIHGLQACVLRLWIFSPWGEGPHRALESMATGCSRLLDRAREDQQAIAEQGGGELGPR
jgi:hypothetical protein